MQTNDKEIVQGLQNAQLLLLKELDRVCELLDISYCLAFGTCLGAARHSGFIPWDDDVDVYMLAEDLNKLDSNRQLFDSDFFLQNQDTDPEYGLMITRLRDSRTTLIEESETDRDINHGIFIDIYPLFFTPRKGIKAKSIEISSMIYRLLLYDKAPKNRGIVMKIGSQLLLKTIHGSRKRTLLNWSYKHMSNCEKKNFVSGLYGNQPKTKFPLNWFFPSVRIKFEDTMIPVPAQYDAYLRYIYGDYMQLPPKEKRVFHHNYVCIDFEKPYKVYKGLYYCKE